MKIMQIMFLFPFLSLYYAYVCYNLPFYLYYIFLSIQRIFQLYLSFYSFPYLYIMPISRVYFCQQNQVHLSALPNLLPVFFLGYQKLKIRNIDWKNSLYFHLNTFFHVSIYLSKGLFLSIQRSVTARLSVFPFYQKILKKKSGKVLGTLRDKTKKIQAPQTNKYNTCIMYSVHLYMCAVDS